MDAPESLLLSRAHYTQQAGPVQRGELTVEELLRIANVEQLLFSSFSYFHLKGVWRAALFVNFFIPFPLMVGGLRRASFQSVALIWVPIRPKQPFFTFSPFRPVFCFKARAGRLSERDQGAVGLPLLLSQSDRLWRWRRMSEATPLQSKWCGKFSAPSGGEA
jgi:hypothetical protein